MKLSVFVSILFFTTKISCMKNPYTYIACENHTLRLHCPDNTEINIQHANYGRSNYETCPHPSIQTNDCAASVSMTVVQNMCEGEQSCVIIASNSIFGDPCIYTYKYLNITFSCESKSRQLIVCEGRRSILQCPQNTFIQITRATYGRTDYNTCPDPRIQTVECSTNSPLSIIKDRCNGRRSCWVTSSNSLYGDPCVYTYKYLTVDFQCTSTM